MLTTKLQPTSTSASLRLPRPSSNGRLHTITPGTTAPITPNTGRPMTHHPEHYILATGGKDSKRLRLLHEVYGPGTEALLRRAGLRDGLRVVEVGCGSGNTACWVAEQVAPGGSVVAVDVSPDQIEQARSEERR